MRKQVTDPQLLAKVAPDYSLGCKRILPSNRWYPALQQPNVELVTGGLQEVRAHSVVDADGREHEVDAIIFGTGFHVSDPPVAEQVRGRDGRLMREVWEGTPRAYLGTAVPGFPNMFLLLGPNTGLGHSSMVYMIETQIEHVLRAIEAMERRGASTIEVRRQRLRGVQPRGRRAHEGDGLGERLLELLLRRDRTQRRAVAGLDVALLAARHQLRRGGLRAHELPSGRRWRHDTGKRIIITGAASGIAAATMAELERRGARCWGSIAPSDEQMIACDVRDQESVDRAVAEAIARLAAASTC